MNSYKKIAIWYSKFSSAFFDRKDILRFVEKSFLSCGIDRECKVLDIGCADAKLLLLLRRRGFKNLYGIDVSSEMIGLALKKIGSKKIKLYNQNFLSFSPRKRFDIALCTMDVVNHIPQKDIFCFFKNISTILKKGGVFIFDINSEKYLKKLGKRKFVVKKLGRAFLRWRFELNSKCLKINFSVKQERGKAVSEDIYQFIYSERFVESVLKACGFIILTKVYDYRLPFKTRFSSKVCYVCRKI